MRGIGRPGGRLPAVIEKVPPAFLLVMMNPRRALTEGAVASLAPERSDLPVMVNATLVAVSEVGTKGRLIQKRGGVWTVLVTGLRWGCRAD
jgi:hypothetical protein